MRSSRRPFCTPARARLSRIDCSKLGASGCWAPVCSLIVSRWASSVTSGEGERTVRAQRLDRERPGDADGLLVLVGSVVQRLEVGMALDRSIDLARGSCPP